MPESFDSKNVTLEPTPWTEISDPSVLAKNPLVSVKMITYNHAPYIAQAIEGVLQQKTSFPVELIIGEDCSTDGTREIVLNFQQKYPNVIRVITSDQNVGMKKNSKRLRNTFRGKYLAYCEGDDYWHDPHKLAKQVNYLESHPECGLIYSSYDVHHCKQNIIIKDFIKYRKWKIIENPKLSDYFVELKPIGGARVGISTCTVMVRRNLYEQVIESDPYLHGSEHFLMGDIQLWAELINVTSIHFIPESMATYRLSEESATRSKDRGKVFRLRVSGAEIMIYLCKKHNLPSNIRSRFEVSRDMNLLHVAVETRNSELAEELRKAKGRWNYLEWLRYFSARNVLFYLIYRTAVKFRDITNSINTDWK